MFKSYFLKKASVSFLTSDAWGTITARFMTVIMPRAKSAASHAQEGAEIAPKKMKRQKETRYITVGARFFVIYEMLSLP